MNDVWKVRSVFAAPPDLWYYDATTKTHIRPLYIATFSPADSGDNPDYDWDDQVVVHHFAYDAKGNEIADTSTPSSCPDAYGFICPGHPGYIDTKENA